MKKIIALTIAGLIMLLPAAAVAQVGPSYSIYARQSVWNQIDTIGMLGDGLKSMFSGSNGESNAAFLAQWQVNATMGANASTAFNRQLLQGITSDTTSQQDLNYGLQSMGNNASQVQCGDLIGPAAPGGKTTGANTTTTQSCSNNATKYGSTRVSQEKSTFISGSTGGSAKTSGAQAIAALIRGGMQSFVLVQKGTVGAVSPFG